VEDTFLNLLYNASDVFVFLSSYEGFGLTPLEALFCGTPAIVSSTSSLKEIFSDLAVLVPPEDPRAIAAKILEVLQDPEGARKKLPSRSELLQRFSWAKTAEAVLEILVQAATQKNH
jgi:glycosyltransferase involved in cell wall biosynthesis